MIKVCLNGSRSPKEHGAVPVTPAQLEYLLQKVLHNAGAFESHCDNKTCSYRIGTHAPRVVKPKPIIADIGPFWQSHCDNDKTFPVTVLVETHGDCVGGIDVACVGNVCDKVTMLSQRLEASTG